jgi:hypothetical protein
VFLTSDAWCAEALGCYVIQTLNISLLKGIYRDVRHLRYPRELDERLCAGVPTERRPVPGGVLFVFHDRRPPKFTRQIFFNCKGAHFSCRRCCKVELRGATYIGTQSTDVTTESSDLKELDQLGRAEIRCIKCGDVGGKRARTAFED